ncbi:MAG: hypothetical protein R3E32_16565 [Chitinophagales bacterium]
MKPTFLCIASFFKGADFLRACKATGSKVYLLTSKKLEHEKWPKEAIDETFYMVENEDGQWNQADMIQGMSWLMRTRKIDRIVALDDFDVEKAALLREHFRISGMGQTTCRYFRDKLAMRVKAADAGINVPAFSGLFNDQEIHDYVAKVEAPWLVKPRSEASATGITKIHSAEDLWKHLEKLGEKRHNYLIEQFRPGDVFHVDALSVDGKVIFARTSQYLNTPFEVAHGGGIFRSSIAQYGGKDDKELQKLNKEVMKAFGMQYSASHTEYIKSKETGEFYFLETSSRVGGAHLAEMVEFSSDINLWGEWAKIEVAKATGGGYKLPKIQKHYTGIIVSLIKYQHPDYSSFTDAEICWKMYKDHHIGMIVKSDKRERVLELLDQYAQRVFQDFHASAPAPDKPTN